MGCYDRFVLPRLIDWAMKNPDVARLRAEWIPQARGRVLEIGMGSGLNLPFYSAEVHSVLGLEPSPELQRKARRQAAGRDLPVEFLSQSAEERLPLPEASIDTAVCTWTLCSIPNAALALQQVRRILKPQGRLLFLEHGQAPDASVVAWQDRLTPVWKRLTGGCHLNRRIDQLLRDAGFEITQLQTGYLPGPRPITYTYQGFAQVN